MVKLVNWVGYGFTMETSFWDSLDLVKCSWKTRPECGRCHYAAWGPGLNTEEKAAGISGLWMSHDQLPYIPAMTSSLPFHASLT